jgi:PKD repeat protein
MNNLSTSIFAFFVLCACIVQNTSAQTWQNSVGTSATDLHWQGLANANGYITVGQTSISNAAGSTNTNLLITQFDNNGAVLWSKVVSMATTSATNYHFEPRDISAAPAAVVGSSNIAAGYYITGVAQNTSPNIGTSMFVMRIDANANMVWLRLNVLPTLNIMQSEGVAVVTLSSGDVIAVGNVLYNNGTSTNTSNQIIAARIAPNNTVVWSNVYFNMANTTGTLANMLAHEATLDPNMVSCSPTVPAIAENGVVLTGEISNSLSTANYGAGPHLLVMFIDANGTECWRNAYPVTNSLSQYMSAGHDIAYNYSTNQYIAVGRAYTSSATAVQNTTYIVRISNAGALSCGSLFHIATNGGVANAFARAIATVNTTGTVGGIAVAGIDITNNASYLMSIPSSNTACPQTATWIKEYLLPPAPAPTAVWTPVAGISGNGVPESIVIGGTSPNTYNYFMTSNTLSTATMHDMHVLRTDANGNTTTNCPAVATTTTTTSTGIMLDLTEQQSVDNSWTTTNAYSTSLTLTQNLCSATNVCTVDAIFTAAASPTATCTYTFANASTGNGTLSYSWNFGDPNSGSNNTSTATNPSHTFSGTGSYNVCLIVTNTLANGTTCTDYMCMTIQVNCPTPCSAAASFLYTTSLPPSCIFTFNSTSTGSGTLSYSWNFGDSASGTNNTSTDSSPIHVFSASGTYTVCLTVTSTSSNGSSCTDTHCESIVVTGCNPPTCTVNSDYCYTINGYQVAFNNSSAGNGTLSHHWSFGDGTGSTATNPVKTYSAAGNYTVCLTVLNTMADGTQCCNTCCKNITINPVCTVNSNFRYCVNGSQVSLTNLSTTGVTYAWYLDGSTTAFSTAYTPPTQILSVGTHTICLETTRSTTTGSCSKYTCKTVVINATCNVLARFSHTACLNTMSATFNNSSVNASTYSWNFGDPASGANNTSTATNPSHTFSSYGTYVVCLTANGSNTTSNANAPCRYKVCQTIQISQPNCTTSCPQICATCSLAPDAEQGNNDMPETSAAKNNSETEGQLFINDGSEIDIFPNPTTNYVQVVYNSGESTATLLKITDVQGKMVKEISLDPMQQSLDIDMREMPNGMYLIAIHHENGTVSGARLIKE